VFMGGLRYVVLSLNELFDALDLLPFAILGYPASASALDKVNAARSQMRCVKQLRPLVADGLSGSISDSVGGCWLSECRDPHDKIYAMLGVLLASQTLGIPVDYSMAWEKLYEHFAHCLVQWGQGSEILGFAGIDTAAAGSPSWIPNWNLSMTTPRRNCSRLSQPGSYYRAGGQARPQIRLFQDGLVFMARGMRFDTVIWISPIARFDYNPTNWEVSVRRELLTPFTRYRSGRSITGAYQRTLIAGMWLFGAQCIDQNVLSDAYEVWQDESWREHGPNWKYYTSYEARWSEFYDCLLQGAHGRRFCITARGYIGLVGTLDS
jgi:hypothetical protein